MKKIIFLAVSLFLINCSNDLDVADVTPNNVKIVSSSESKLRSNIGQSNLRGQSSIKNDNTMLTSEVRVIKEVPQ